MAIYNHKTSTFFICVVNPRCQNFIIDFVIAPSANKKIKVGRVIWFCMSPLNKVCGQSSFIFIGIAPDYFCFITATLAFSGDVFVA